MMNVRKLAIDTMAILALTCGPVASASEQMHPKDNLCDSIATPEPALFVDDSHKKMREAIGQQNWGNIRVLIWDGADPGLLRNTRWYRRARHELRNRDLVHASAVGDVHLIMELLRLGADVNVKANYDNYMSPLIWAARCDQASAAQLLLAKGARPDITSDHTVGSTGIVQGSTPLMWAASRGNVEVIKVLLAKGADPNAQETVTFDVRKPNVKQKGNTPLVDAANRQTTELLLDAHADPNLVGVRGISALMRAAGNGDIGQCELLLAHGANPLLRDMDGQTAVDFAKRAEHPEIADLLERVARK